MSINTWPPAGDDQDIIAQTDALDKQRQQMSTGVDANVAARVAEIYRANPWMQPGQILALAKANASDKLVAEASKLAGANAPKYTEPPRKKNWFERNVYDPLKAATRYTFATLNLAPELAQNVASQVLNKDNPAGFDGWFKSTSLGTMIAASRGEVDPVTGQQISAGDGFFLGGTAYEKQAERARAVRGTINGRAWTLGRGAAAVAFAPGTKPYNILSGFVDAAVNVFADPTLYAGKALKGVRTARAAVPSLQTIPEISAFQKVAAAGGELAAAGLDQAETIAWNGSKFRNWATTNGKARYLTRVLAENDNAYDIFENVFKGNIDIPIANRLAKAKSQDEVLAIMGEAANRMDTELSGLFPTDIREVVRLRDRVPYVNTLQKKRLFTTMPDAVITAGSAKDNMKAVQSYGRYLRTLGGDLSPETFDNFMSKAMDIYGNPNGASVAELNSLFEEVVKETVGTSLKRGGVLGVADAADVDSLTSKIFESVRGLQDNLRIYMMNEAGEIDDFGALQALIDAGKVTVPDDFNPAQIGRLRMAGPGSLVELADKTYVLPDVRTVRRLTSNPFIRRAISKKSGDQRGLIAVADYLQNEIWKPLTLATGGYIFRNMFDAQIRIAAVGLKGFFTHPIDYIMMVAGKAMPESLVGRIGLDELDELEATGRMTRAQQEFAEGMGMGMRRHVDDPVQAMRRGFRNRVIQRVNINDPDKAGYLDALFDDIRRMSQDQLGNWVGKNATSDEIVDWLRNNPDGAESLRKIETYLKNGIEAYDPVTRKMGYAKITNGEIDDDILKWWVERLNSPRIQQLGGKDDTIRFAMSYRRMPLAASETIDSTTLRDADFVDGSLKRGKGSIIKLPGTNVEAIVIDTNNGTNWTVRQMSDFDVFDDEQGIAMFKEYLRNVAETNPSILPTWSKRVGESYSSAMPGMSKKDLAVVDLKNRAVDAFFNGVYGKVSKKFERSPVFRQFYYNQIIDNADLLSAEEARLFRQSIPGRAANLDMTPEAVFGGKKQYQKLLAKLDAAEKKKMKVPFDVGATPTPENPASGILFHGTANPLAGNRFEDIMDVYTPDANNLFGRGVYLTDSPKVAASYSKKGAKSTATIDGLKVGKEGVVYNTRLAQDARMLDLTQPNANIRNEIRRISESNSFEYLIANEGVDIDAVDRLFEALAKDDLPAENLIAAFKSAMKGAPLYDVDEFMLGLTENMQKYADVLKYRGGVRVGTMGEHNAYVVLNTNKLRIEQSSEIAGFMENVVAGVSKSATAGTIKQLEEYATLRALQSTKATLFNAVERNNLQDILRIIVPFGPAWSEVMSSYANFLIDDPRLIRRAQQVFTGAANYDPDGDGQGFFFKDPVTGENSFYIPFSGELSKLLTGVNAPMQANVKGLSMGLQVYPAVGPVVQMAASQIIPDTPSTDSIVEFLLPYGRKGPDSLTPGWVRKLYSAVEANPGKLESIYGNTYVETVRALSASGEYDLDMPAEKEQLLEDAKGKARILTGFRALSQFLGPTAASPEFIVPTNEGDIMSSYLITAFNKLQTQNYDTAVSEFMRIYGEDALLYVSSKSRSTVPGIEATDQFGDWERKNEQLLQSYPKAAAYFAPGGDDFSFSTWERQIRTGARERLSAPEIIELAQYRIGSAIYRDLKRQAGQYPNQEVRDWLARQRQKIHEQYPGFPAQAVFTIGEFRQTVEQLRNVANDPRTQGNEVATAVKEYFKYRDQAIAQYVAAGGRESGFGQAKQTLELRQWLFNIGNALAETYPDFQRVWDRELSSEVD